MNELDKLCAQAKDLCREIAARDLSDAPLYIVPQSRLPRRLGGKSVCYGFTGSLLDLHLREIIGSDWKGRGPCMVVNDLAHRVDTPDDFERRFLGTAVHELAHIVLWPKRIQEKAEVPADRLKADIDHIVERFSSREWFRQRPVPWQGHDIFFIRTALHLRHRAERAGVELAPSQLCAGDRFGLSAGIHYHWALGDEPERMLDATFHEIKRQSMPNEFLHLWVDDIGRWKPEPEEPEEDEENA